ncbi:ribonuclease P/MRP 30 subunit [Capsaspora owczarzaki ATCC 30864]|uniref:Ribonuclease P/MRP 30 subunit n=1 Tax=Capsaspora owczarzaki (strain ATCC 30864) TaxID=595528 RepID=A0A0D2U7R9_CAPO3|nr:ribonuclease P/MRP 30 subunit [Capsaspora owczarzaki ATCC 30864]KJE91126.1 ribonuclease P/MRP 30 subunit [Capsaspora owczarzaki ATCC 30864]|eukprot:XP_004349060.2 ribonuclease P/MRP 30 subunit [Capsaspora owczarzaki ATCC 30864]
MFVDLCVSAPATQSDRLQFRQHLTSFGYGAVAYNQRFAGRIAVGKNVPPPPFVPAAADGVHAPSSSSSTPTSNAAAAAAASNIASSRTRWTAAIADRLKQTPTSSMLELSRLTVVIADQQDWAGYCTNYQQVLKNYDILAVQPETEKLLQQCLQSSEVDIITLDMSKRTPFFIKHSMARVALEQGIVFELLYTDAIRNSESRRSLILNALSLIRATKGRNVILSSGAQKPIELRSPYDVMNLGLLFGLTHERSRNCLTSLPRGVLYHAETRLTTGLSAVRITPLAATAAKADKAGSKNAPSSNAAATMKPLANTTAAKGKRPIRSTSASGDDDDDEDEDEDVSDDEDDDDDDDTDQTPMKL